MTTQLTTFIFSSSSFNDEKAMKKQTSCFFLFKLIFAHSYNKKMLIFKQIKEWDMKERWGKKKVCAYIYILLSFYLFKHFILEIQIFI